MAAIDRRLFNAGLASSLIVPSLTPTRARAAGPRTLVGVIEEDPPFLNPAVSSTISNYVGGCPVYSALTRMNAKAEVSGDLAERWEISPDGLTYTFHLRPNIKWHDGKPFSSADVVFSLEHVNSKFHPYRGALKSIVKFEAPDPRTVVLRLAKPQASLINTLHSYAGCILPKHLWEGTDILKNPHMKKPIGTGPYKFVEFAAGNQITFVRNKDYFMPGKPVFDEITLRIIPDASARVAALETGEVDMIYFAALPGTQVERLRKLPGIAMKYSRVQASVYKALINTRNAPFGDVRVRQAMAHAINKGFVRSAVLPGLSSNMVGPVPPTSALYNPNLKDYDYNPARANELLDEAGLKRGADGTRFQLRFLHAVNDLVGGKIGDIVRQNFAAVGIRTVLTPLERATWMQRSFIDNNFDVTVFSANLAPDPDLGVERFYNSNNIVNQPYTNNSAYRNPAVDKLFDEQRVQLDFGARKAIYDKIQAMIWADIPIIPICAYDIPGAVQEDNVLGVFEQEGSNREDFAFAIPGKKAR